MVTYLIAGLLGVLLFKISMATIKVRRKEQISVGTNSNKSLIAMTSAHSNFVAYAPMGLILLYLLESSGHIPKLIILILGLVFFVGRLFHYQAFCGDMDFKKRKVGMIMTLRPIMGMSVLVIIMGLLSFFNSVL